MTGEESKSLGFREWTVHYEREQEADRGKLNALTEAVSNINSNVGALTANVNTLMDNQKGLSDRVNRPANWGIFATFAGVIFMIVGLVVSGIKDDIGHMEIQHALDIERNLSLHMWFRDSIDDNTVQISRNEVNMEWAKVIEERYNRRIHQEITD